MMTKKNCLLALTAAMLAACGGNPKGTELVFETIQVDKNVSIDNEADAPKCTVHLELAEASASQGEAAKAINAAVARRLFNMEELSMQQAADSFANNYCRNYVEHYRPLYREDKNDPMKRSWYDYHYTVTTETAAGREGVVTYTAVVDYYEGGAHGLNQQLLMNFDTATGRELALADLLVTGYENQLNALLLNALKEETDSKSLEELREKGYLYSMEMYPSANFALTDDGIRFVYNVYEIAPYAVGRIELTVSNNELKGILK